MSKNSEAVKRWRKNTKRRAVAALGGRCVVCALQTHIMVYDFHHVENRVGRQTIGDLMSSIKSWARIVEDLRRCVLVCSNCHRLVHHGLVAIPEGAARFDEQYVQYRPRLDYGLCEVCERPLVRKGRCCSTRCAGLASRKVKRPTKRELARLLKKHSFCGVGRMFGVSDNAVRKWLKD